MIIKPKAREGLCSVPNAAEFLSVSRGKMYKMLNAGDCPYKRFGKSVRIPWTWLLQQAEVADSNGEGGAV